jgi:hypothetical protein
VDSAYLRVVTIGEDGVTRALNHFNKHGKGAVVRRLAQTRPRIATRKALMAWADTAGVALRDGAPGEIDLVV